jgi:hypothetical protein
LSYNKSISAFLTPLALTAIFLLAVAPPNVSAQESSSWWGSNYWFDWTDFRANASFRVYIPKLISGSVKRVNLNGDYTVGGISDSDLTSGYNFDPDPDFFREFLFELYIDRLGLRIVLDEEQVFKGMLGNHIYPSFTTGSPSPDSNHYRMSLLKADTERIGFDIDIIRYPFLRMGVDFDYNLSPLKFVDRKEAWLQWRTIKLSSTVGETWPYRDGTTYWGPYFSPVYHLVGYNAFTVGVHGKAIPMRIREIPVTLNGRLRVPMPWINQWLNVANDTRVFDWEVSAGIRPAVWNMSTFGLSSFSVGLEVGFRSQSIEANMQLENFSWVEGGPPPEIPVSFKYSNTLKAHWQGVFGQLSIAY